MKNISIIFIIVIFLVSLINYAMSEEISSSPPKIEKFSIVYLGKNSTKFELRFLNVKGGIENAIIDLRVSFRASGINFAVTIPNVDFKFFESYNVHYDKNDITKGVLEFVDSEFNAQATNGISNIFYEIRITDELGRKSDVKFFELKPVIEFYLYYKGLDQPSPFFIPYSSSP